jgi:hypothetical protein
VDCEWIEGGGGSVVGLIGIYVGEIDLTTCSNPFSIVVVSPNK